MALFKVKKDEPAPFEAPQAPYPPPQQEYNQPSPMEMQNQGYSTQQIYGYADPAQQQQQQQQMPQQPAQQEYSINEQKIEEVAEAIIDEKWNELLKDINKMVEWKETTEQKITKIQTEIENLKTNFDALHKGILGKVSEYDQNLIEVGTEIKAMEKVFQKILPTFTENVNKLSRITKTVSFKK
ncbi:MAG: hypothetical protein ABIC04_07960 [Nanoarchaeota archaeon]